MLVLKDVLYVVQIMFFGGGGKTKINKKEDRVGPF